MTPGARSSPRRSNNARRTIKSVELSTIALAVCVHAQRGAAPPGGQPPPAGRGGGGRGRGAIITMTLTSSGWSDGGRIPVKYTQGNGPAGENSPPLAGGGGPPNPAEI